MSRIELQMNCVDEMANRENRSNRTARFLDKLGAVVDFTPIAAALREAYTATRGREPHDPLVMFKMTLLQHFYDLSDPECEAQVADRRSFREFGWNIDSAYAGPRGQWFPIGSYGHTGWTGGSLWIDPFSRTFLIFLSNRNHPAESGNVLPLRRALGTIAAEASCASNSSCSAA